MFALELHYLISATPSELDEEKGDDYYQGSRIDFHSSR
jgi:hypothetical protein